MLQTDNEVMFFKANMDLANPDTDCKSMKDGQLLLFRHEEKTVVDEHIHDESHIVFIREGSVMFIVEGKEYDLTVGDTIIIPANAKHSFKVTGDQPVRTACLAVR